MSSETTVSIDIPQRVVTLVQQSRTGSEASKSELLSLVTGNSEAAIAFISMYTHNKVVVENPIGS